MLVKVKFLFPTNMKLPFYQESKDDLLTKTTPKDDILLPKNAPKDGISNIAEKDGIHPKKDDIAILCSFMETF